MLEIKNVTKIYKTRGGAESKALDDVSITFKETGLVFLLGKSGSGKSTLLNISGGLDEPTCGEIKVKGKSSKQFTGSDFDSYRNTFVGFVFQEYNILDEFNVEENVALALELQGKPRDSAKINAILQEVELSDYAKRRPNTLSGGQKQRIAIARALVKDPQIIMADEPTGALDSATGKQVFDTLKRLSQTRLVIVVSHDREFAEIYGDRIVELKDGKIISDVSKSSVAPEKIDENVSIIGGSTISVKSGANLTEENLQTIKRFIADAEGDVIISKGKAEISNFKKSNRLSDNGAMEKFSDTDTDNFEIKNYSAEESKFIRSRLPAGKALRIGASGLKLKPVRLVFTILLSLIAFTTFGLFSTLMVYDGDKVAVQSYVKSENDWLNVTKTYQTRSIYDDGYVWENNDNEAELTEEEVSEFAAKYGSNSFGYYKINSSIANAFLNKTESDYYANVIQNVAYISGENKLRQKITSGEYPENANQIMISTYTLSALSKSTVNAVKIVDGEMEVDGENTVSIDSAASAIGKHIALQVNGEFIYLQITGVYDCGKIPSKFDGIKEGNESNFLIDVEYSLYLSLGLPMLALVSENFYEAHKNVINPDENFKEYFDLVWNQFKFTSPCRYYENGWHQTVGDNEIVLENYAKAFGAENSLPVRYLGNANGLRADNEVIVPSGFLSDSCLSDDIIEQLMLNKTGGDYEKAKEIFDAFYKDLVIYNFGKRYVGEATEEERAAALQRICLTLKDLNPIDLELEIDGVRRKMKIVGIYENDFESYYREGVYLTQNFIDNYFNSYPENFIYETNYVKPENATYSGVYIDYDHSEEVIAALLETVGAEHKAENDAIINLNGWLYSIINIVNDTVDILYIVFLVVGIIFALFASLLMFNFISVSISNKKKEIGILRAVGARGLDVFKIFFSESGIIMGICTVLSIISAVMQCLIINGVLKSLLGFEVSLFVFGGVSVAVMLGIAVAVTVVSTLLPVYLAARKKPVESIRSL